MLEHKFIFGEKLEKRYLKIVEKVGSPFISLGISPNFFTLIGLVFAFLTGIIFYRGYMLVGGLMLWFAGFFDNLDGVIARKSNKVTNFGALLDSTLDRYGEFFVYIGLWGYFRHSHTFGTVFCEFLILLIILGSYAVSYVRARAEGLGLECKVGLFQRAERIVILGLGAIVSGIFNGLAAKVQYVYLTDIFLKIALLVLAVGSNYTALERIFHVRNVCSESEFRRF
ncbi:CDP-alcohol phosphatidyltransferase family protein [bacterium]|nr:CDP-alcohol phosphatidyltransferase family protein [bacterium]